MIIIIMTRRFMNVYDLCNVFQRYLRSNKNGDLNPDLCNASAVLLQLSYQANCELVVMWVDDKCVDDGYGSLHMMLIHEKEKKRQGSYKFISNRSSVYMKFMY